LPRVLNVGVNRICSCGFYASQGFLSEALSIQTWESKISLSLFIKDTDAGYPHIHSAIMNPA
jgi:hypothetical protein